MPIHLLLFIDKRPSLHQEVQQIRSYLQQLQDQQQLRMQVIEVSEQPYLAEMFKVVATPALVKIFPDPKQTLTGSDLIAQFQKCWPRWQKEASVIPMIPANNQGSVAATVTGIDAVNYSTQMLKLADEVFQLKQDNEKLLEQLNFKEQVLSMLAHDLRSPLTAASLALETIELTQSTDRGINSATKEQLFKQARNQFRLMEQMISGILQAAKHNQAELRIVPTRIQIGHLCVDALEQIHDKAMVKHHQLITDIPQVLPEVYADAAWIKQVMVNLLDNAVKFTPKGGQIGVSVLHRTMQKIQVSVSDTGPGIPEENREKIFENQFRLNRDRDCEGYGIGLSLCQKVVRAHYGQIWVDCPKSGGSCFHFTLPVYR
jgi:two-component system clock-associated histidine kinase SasA